MKINSHQARMALADLDTSIDHFIEVAIKPDAEMSESVLLNKVYAKFHQALLTLNASDIGVSFPEQDVALGLVMRLHSTESRLLELESLQWLDELIAYCLVTKVTQVPDQCQHRTISHKQSTMTLSKLRRLTNRGAISPAKAKEYRARISSEGLGDPFLELEGELNGERHRKYIVPGNLLSEPVAGDFDQFGLSKTATIPWF